MSEYILREVLEPSMVGAIENADTVGIDIGSRASKGVLLHDGKIFTEMEISSVSSRRTAEELLEKLLKEANLDRSKVKGIVGTGYGEVALDFKDIAFRGVTEITCHGMGAHYMNKNTRTIIDIGGQDSKAIKINPENGDVLDFIMNDKCAAGTGRFLEKVAMLLELSLDELGEYAVRSRHPVEISSQCVVFAESEVISLKAKGYPKEDIAAGIHYANARRIKSLLRRVGFEKDILFSGGVSHNRGMRKALEDTIGITTVRPKLDATYAGALGAAIEAADHS